MGSRSQASAEGDKLDGFIRLLTDHQVDMQAFIMSSLGNHADTLDVLQQTNIALWKKEQVYKPEAPFLPWAIGVARFEVLTFIRKQSRDRHKFSPEVVELLVDVASERAERTSLRGQALLECIERLSERKREFLRIRYAQEQSVKQVAEKTGRTAEAVKSLFLRIRKTLDECINQRLRIES